MSKVAFLLCVALFPSALCAGPVVDWMIANLTRANRIQTPHPLDDEIDGVFLDPPKSFSSYSEPFPELPSWVMPSFIELHSRVRELEAVFVDKGETSLAFHRQKYRVFAALETFYAAFYGSRLSPSVLDAHFRELGCSLARPETSKSPRPLAVFLARAESIYAKKSRLSSLYRKVLWLDVPPLAALAAFVGAPALVSFATDGALDISGGIWLPAIVPAFALYFRALGKSMGRSTTTIVCSPCSGRRIFGSARRLGARARSWRSAFRTSGS